MSKKICYEIEGYYWSDIDKEYVNTYYCRVYGKKEFKKEILYIIGFLDKIIWYDSKKRCGVWKRMA